MGDRRDPDRSCQGQGKKGSTTSQLVSCFFAQIAGVEWDQLKGRASKLQCHRHHTVVGTGRTGWMVGGSWIHSNGGPGCSGNGEAKTVPWFQADSQGLK